MEHNSNTGAALPAAYLSPGTSSFVDFLRAQAPELLPFNRVAPGARPLELAHGTTIVAVAYKGGVLIAGDRRATAGNVIAHRDMDKVYVTDEYSAVGIAGTAGLAVEMVRLYQLELEHYEKLEGVTITLDGKANRLGAMIKGNLEAAMAGLVVLPLFVGYDVDAPDPDRAGRIVTYDVTGGRFDEHAGYHSIGSGSVFAKGSLKKLYDPDADQDAAVRTAIEALYDAADDDSATSGPDLVRRIFPVVITVDGVNGAVRVADETTAAVSEAVVADRTRG
ncbi:proteasome subunit beta [Kutzneria sp. NPDC052558]|uniref:proteasome subunit beta n=1 Tax=Kutzneria sp. NPDC052558 TaxID=3364121 RepID=UPI0037C8102C